MQLGNTIVLPFTAEGLVAILNTPIVSIPAAGWWGVVSDGVG